MTDGSPGYVVKEGVWASQIRGFARRRGHRMGVGPVGIAVGPTADGRRQGVSLPAGFPLGITVMIFRRWLTTLWPDIVVMSFGPLTCSLIPPGK